MSPLVEGKVCGKCKKWKSSDEFYKSKNKTHGLTCYCKTCSYLNHKEYIENHPEKVSEYNKRATQKRIINNVWGKKDNITKVCPRCEIEKDSSEFHKNRSMPNGINNYCKECKNEMDRLRYHELKSDPSWLEKERNRNKERMRKRRNLPIIKELELINSNIHRREKWRTDPEYRKKSRDYKRKLYNTNPDYRIKVCQRNDRWNKSTKGMVSRRRIYNRRRYQELNTVNDLTDEHWMQILSSQDDKCLACGQKFDDELQPTMDHIIPVSLGGGLTFDNVQALCLPCNARKHNKIIDYRKEGTQGGFLSDYNPCNDRGGNS